MANKFLTSIKARYFGATSSTAIDIGVDGDAEPRVKIDAGGRVTWGSGAVTGDVTLYRDAENVLKTDNTFKSAQLFIDGIQLVTSGADDGDVLTYDAAGDVWGAAAAVASLTPVAHSQIVIDESYVFPANYNGLSVGPVTIDNSVGVTVSNGSVWMVL